MAESESTRIPKRVQMSRQHPWRADNPDAVIVSRPGPFGNQFRVMRGCDDEWLVVDRDDSLGDYTVEWLDSRPAALASSVEMFRAWIEGDSLAAANTRFEARRDLAGHDLACWCRPDLPCHADVLLEIANRPGEVG